MLRQTRRVAVGAVLALAALASSAGAECAWVLWASTYCTGAACSWHERVRPIEGFNAKSECGAILKQWEAATKPPEETHYKCLPDTVDPRAPKAK